MTRFARPLLLVLIAASAFIASCQVDPLTGKNTLNLYSYEDEKQMGDESVQPIIAELGGLYPDQATQQYVDRVGQKVVVAGRSRLKGEAFHASRADHKALQRAITAAYSRALEVREQESLGLKITAAVDLAYLRFAALFERSVLRTDEYLEVDAALDRCWYALGEVPPENLDIDSAIKGEFHHYRPPPAGGGVADVHGSATARGQGGYQSYRALFAGDEARADHVAGRDPQLPGAHQRSRTEPAATGSKMAGPRRPRIGKNHRGIP